MSIYINGRFLLQPQTGVNRFAYEMTKAIIKREDNIQVIMPYGEVSNDYDVSDFNIIRVGLPIREAGGIGKGDLQLHKGDHHVT